METKTCQNCKTNFIVESEDFEFYEKIKVPAPTWCTDCRMMRRMVWRNERNLYKRTCGLCDKPIITIYSPDKPFTVYCQPCYRSASWDPMSCGIDYDPSRSFLEQFRELQIRVPRLYAFVFQNTNSDYTNGSAFNKNCYLLFVSDHNEDSQYSHFIMHCRDCIDLLDCYECERCYESVSCKKCYQVLYSKDCVNSQNLWFSKNCSNSHDCFGCVNLRNAQYQIYNEQYDKDAYFKKLREFRLDTPEGIKTAKATAHEFWLQFPVKYMAGLKNIDVTGESVSNSKNTKESYNSELLEDCKFINYGNGAKSCYDGHVVVDGCEFSYEIVSAIALQNCKSCFCTWHAFECEYCDTCENSNNLFGCISLQKKQYCILNKQYTKEEYHKLREKIVSEMRSREEYGEFFPLNLSPFAYNETAAQENFPLDKETTEKSGLLWKQPEARDYKIGGDIHGCSNNGTVIGCTVAFKMTPQELEFYRQINLPMPDICPNCRHSERLKLKNPLRLWHRKCMKDGCENEFETSYSPDRPEIVYCEQCYQQEVV